MPGSVTSDEVEDSEDAPPEDEEAATQYWVDKLVASGGYARVKLLAKGGNGGGILSHQGGWLLQAGCPNMSQFVFNFAHGSTQSGECTVTTIDDFLSPRQDESEKSS